MKYILILAVLSFTFYGCQRGMAPANICDACGEVYNRKDLRQHYCQGCKELIGKNFKKLKLTMDAAYA